MTDAYSVGESPQRPLTREPYRGARIRNRRTGEIRYWVGDRYVSQNDRARLSPQERDALSQAEAAAANYQQHLPDLNRFEELNRTVPTGSLSHRVGQFLGNMPRIFSFDSDPGEGNSVEGYEEMRAINSRLTPDQREPGSGSSSNLDVQMFREGLPNLANSGPTNSNIIGGFRRQARDSQEYSDFLNWYWPRTGSLNNAQAEFNRYRTARRQNPDLNWRQFFNAGQPGATQAPPRRPPNVPPEARWDANAQQWVAD